MQFSIIHHVDRKTIDHMQAHYVPVFIISTGRSGSKFIAELLNEFPDVSAFHEPRPSLQSLSNYFFHSQEKEESLAKIFEASRLEMILQEFIEAKIYVESNQCMTFLAPAIKQVFQSARFIHLVRHPGDFIRSAIMKGWHLNDSIWESGRVKMTNLRAWEGLTQIEKLSWLWAETNRYIDEFTKGLSEEEALLVRSEDLFSDLAMVKKVCRFTGFNEVPNDAWVLKKQSVRVNTLAFQKNEPPNMKKISEFSSYCDWTPEMKKQVDKYAAEMAERFGYVL